MPIIHDALQAVMKKAVALAPDSFMPGGTPDPLIRHKHGLIGAPISRIDGPLKVAGRATFAAEYPLGDMVYAALKYSTIARGRIAAIDSAAAEAADGVVLVMTYRNAPRLKPMPPFMSKPKAAGGDDVPIMQDDQIHWNGQPVALVLAHSQEQADHAQSMIRITYEESAEAVTSLEAAKAKGSTTGVFQGEPLKLAIKDAEAALAAAPHKVDARYTTPRHNHNPIELHAATLFWDGGDLRIHDATQAVDHAAWTISQVFELKEEQVRVTSPYVGGGFGSKTLWQHHILAAAAAKLAKRPVRIMLSREGVFRIVGGRTVTEQRVAIGAQNDGGFDALIHTGTVVMSPHNNMPEPFILPAKSAYAAKSFLLDVETVRMNMTANTFMRAPGEAVGSFGLECAIDELASSLGMDPIELRIKNEPDEDPTTGLPFSQRDIVQAWRKGADRFGWSKRQAPGAHRDGEWLVGTGCATGTYPYYRMPGGAARISLTRAGLATVSVAAHEMGMGTATVHTQVSAERLGLPMEAITFHYADNILPGTVLAGGSQQTASVGSGIIAAHRALVKRLLQLAGNDSPLAGLSHDEVGGLDAGLCALDDETRYESYASILERAQLDEVTEEAEAPMPLETQHWSMHSHSALFCEVRVNAVTGEIRVSRFLGSFDCGTILNSKTAASQFRGGIIMGLGLALMEETQFDERTGRVMNPSLAEYHVPVHLDVPQIDVIWNDEPDPHAPMGARGIGEIGITGVGAAVANAVFNATGKTGPRPSDHVGQGVLTGKPCSVLVCRQSRAGWTGPSTRNAASPSLPDDRWHEECKSDVCWVRTRVRLRVMISFYAAVSLSVATIFASCLPGSAVSAAEPTSRSMMIAASSVLSETLSTQDHVVMRSAVAATSPEFRISFERVAKCTFAERFDIDHETRFAVIDFSKLDGLYTFQKSSLSFYGSGRSFCIGTSTSRSHCYNGVVIGHATDQRKIVDDVRYILTHGCGDLAPDLLLQKPSPEYRKSPPSNISGVVLSD